MIIIAALALSCSSRLTSALLRKCFSRLSATSRVHFSERCLSQSVCRVIERTLDLYLRLIIPKEHYVSQFVPLYQYFSNVSPEFSKLVIFGTVVIFDTRTSLDFAVQKSCGVNAPLLFDSTLNLCDKSKSSQNRAPETMRSPASVIHPAALTLSKLRFYESCLSNVRPPFRQEIRRTRRKQFSCRRCCHRTITLCRRDDVAAPARRVFARILMPVVCGQRINLRSNVVLRLPRCLSSLKDRFSY